MKNPLKLTVCTIAAFALISCGGGDSTSNNALLGTWLVQSCGPDADNTYYQRIYSTYNADNKMILKSERYGNDPTCTGTPKVEVLTDSLTYTIGGEVTASDGETATAIDTLFLSSSGAINKSYSIYRIEGNKLYLGGSTIYLDGSTASKRHTYLRASGWIKQTSLASYSALSFPTPASVSNNPLIGTWSSECDTAGSSSVKISYIFNTSNILTYRAQAYSDNTCTSPFGDIKSNASYTVGDALIASDGKQATTINLTGTSLTNFNETNYTIYHITGNQLYFGSKSTSEIGRPNAINTSVIYTKQ